MSAPRWSKSERSQSLVETALLMPFIFILMLMVVEFGFLLWSHLNVNAAAREAARYAAVANSVAPSPDPNDCEETKTVKGRAVTAGITRIECVDVTVNYLDTTDDPGPAAFIGRGDEVVVRISHPYEWLTPVGDLMASFGFPGLSGTLTLSACADARLERSYPDQDDANLVISNTNCAS
jgi:hypothetical protein